MKRTVLLVAIFCVAALAVPWADGAGLQKTSITAVGNILSVGPAERAFVTPSGVVHRFQFPELVQYTGDFEGLITFHADATRAQDGTHLMAHGPFDGDITFKGRTGHITGMWETNCKWDDAINNLSCGGVMNFRGEGDLEGVQFHTEWGPGWWPFTSTGTAFSPW